MCVTLRFAVRAPSMLASTELHTRLSLLTCDVSVCVHKYTCRPRVNVDCLPSSLSTLLRQASC